MQPLLSGFNEFPGKSQSVAVIYLSSSNTILGGLILNVFFFFFWLIAHKSRSASVTNSNAGGNDILINSDESMKWDCCFLAPLHLGWFVSAPHWQRTSDGFFVETVNVAVTAFTLIPAFLSLSLQMKSTEVDQGLFTDSYCKVCSAQLISESQRVAHYEVETPPRITSHAYDTPHSRR